MLDFIAVPFGYAMRFIYDMVGNYGLSIILFTLFTQLVLLPLNWKQKKGMVDVQRIQPKMMELQKKYANNRDKYAQEVQKLYDEQGVSPMTGCLPMLLTFPIMIGLYYVVARPLTYFMGLNSDQISTLAKALKVTATNPYTLEIALAGELSANFATAKDIVPGLMQVNFNFLGLNLAKTPSFKDFSVLWIIPVLSGATAYMQSWVMRKMQQRQGAVQDGAMNTQNAMMNIMMPAMSIYFGFILPAGLGVYWIARNVFTVGQDLILTPYFIRKSREKEAALLAAKPQKKKKAEPQQLTEGEQPPKDDEENR
ncbi:YidC/Oxa1 family membrane protein insertase [Acidaminobacterium chupaoyuni]